MPEHSANPVRVYLSTVPGDADAEREILARRFPDLARRAAGRGIALVLVDPLADPAPGDEGWDLAHRLAALDTCAFFIALLGERYGELPVPPIPEPLLARHPWLADRSTPELEIRYELESAGLESQSFFYLRDAAGLAARPPFEEASPEAAARLADLKDLIRASGRPVVDGYAAAWNEAEGRITGLEPFAERVLADLWEALLSGLTPQSAPESGERSFSVSNAPPAVEAISPGKPQGPPDKPLPLHEDVRFTVYRPRVVPPLAWCPLVVFAHLDALSSELSAKDREEIREIEDRAREAFADLPQGFSGESEDSSLAIPDEAEITFVPSIAGVRFNPPRATFLWLEALHREDFRLQAAAALDGKTARGSLSVFWGQILIAELNLKIQVDSRLAAAPLVTPDEREEGGRYQDIFASYSHKDTAIVDQFERYIQALGNRYLIDRETLRAGEVWDDRLRGMIRQADVFQLFWSRNAMESAFVEQEWRYALSLGRDTFIRPTYWEDPLPELPARGLPPEDLRRLHFYRFPGGPAVLEAVPAQAAAPPRKRGRKMLWASSAAAAVLVAFLLPTFFFLPAAGRKATTAKPPVAIAGPGPSVTLSSKVAAAGKIPAAETTEFTPGATVIATIPIENLPEGSRLQVRWVGPAGTTVAEEVKTVPVGSDPLTFRLKGDTLRQGAYKAEVSINGRRVAGKTFAVK